MKYLILIILFCAISCNDSKISGAKAPLQQDVKPLVHQKDSVFRFINDYPFVRDSAAFVNNLLEITNSRILPSEKERGSITTFEKVEIYGYNNSLYLVEFDYGEGDGASFPWKFQTLFNENGKLVGHFNGLKYRFINVFPGKPLFLITSATSKGNGGHELYKINLKGKAENIYKATLRTYDKHEDDAIYKPNELNLVIQDYNKDGCNDLIFRGTRVYTRGKGPDGSWYDSIVTEKGTIEYSIDNPFKKQPLKLVFLYNSESGYFEQMEDYEEKYDLYK